jgi:YidC/Oxa1 family membrane protein insertase
MQKNLAVAMLLSFVILVGWDVLFLRPQARRKADLAQGPTTVPALAPAEGTVAPSPRPASSGPRPSTERLLEHEVGRHKLAFNLGDGSIQQWMIREEKEGDWVALIPQPDAEVRPFDAFPNLSYSVLQAQGNEVVLESRGEMRVTKSWRLDPEGYLHAFSLELRNNAAHPRELTYGLGWGPGIRSGDPDVKEEKGSQRALGFDAPRLHKLKEGRVEGNFKWWGVDARYFLAALLNERGQSVHITVDEIDDYYAAKRTTTLSLAPGATHRDELRFYAGPKGYDQLASHDLDLERAVDFGVFGGLGKAILRSLYYLYGLTRNYGWSIVILTIGLQILLLPLTMKSFRHSLKMKALQPQMKKIQELYKKDPKRLNTEMLHLYQRHGMKFMGMEGCFPVLLQLPIFWALYTTLRNAYELRHAPWIFWIKDLSAHDPFYALPILMGAGMLVQQKMTMSTADPTQARMMYMMPVIFTFFFLKLPSGLVLYWLTNSVVSIIVQTWMLKRQPSAPLASK